MCPEVFLKFAKARQAYGDVDVLPTPQFSYGMERGQDIAVALEPGKALAVKFQTVGEPHPGGTRTVFFELNGQPREVPVRGRGLEVKAKARRKADPAQPGEIGAPIPGVSLGRLWPPACGQRLMRGTLAGFSFPIRGMPPLSEQAIRPARSLGKLNTAASAGGNTVQPPCLALTRWQPRGRVRPECRRRGR